MSERPLVGVLASGAGTNLQALLDTVHGRDVDIVGVGADHADAPALARAATAAVPTRVFAMDAFADRAARDQALGDWLDELGVELVVLAGYLALLSDAFIARFRDRIVNVHPSLLPAFPGLRAIEQAVAYGVKVTGVTVHLVDEGVDTGAILLQRAVDIGDLRDPVAVHDRLRPVEHELLPRAVRLLAADAMRRDPADPRWVMLDGGAE